MEAATEERRQEFNNIPPERVFYTLKLYLNDEGDIVGDCAYDGPALMEMGASQEKARECDAVAQLTTRGAKRAVSTVAQMLGVERMLQSLLGGINEQNNDEGSGERQPTDGLSGDGEGGSVRTVGREEDATNSPSD